MNVRLAECWKEKTGSPWGLVLSVWANSDPATAGVPFREVRVGVLPGLKCSRGRIGVNAMKMNWFASINEWFFKSKNILDTTAGDFEKLKPITLTSVCLYEKI